MRIALLKNSIVDNIAEVVDLATAVALYPQFLCKDVETVPCGTGWTFDGSTYTPPVQVPRTTIRKADFFLRFTDAEITAIYNDAKTRPATQLALKRLETMDSVDLGLSQNITRINTLETLGLIAAGRAAQILALP
jgi:hypothetical protein